MNDFSFSLNDNPLHPSEKQALQGHLSRLELNETIWDLYETLLRTATRDSIPLFLRMKKGEELAALVVLIKCFDHGMTLTGFGPAIRVMKRLRLPVHIWMRSGIGAELLANPGFVSDRFDPEEIMPVLIDHMSKHFFLSFVLDLSANNHLYEHGTPLPYPDEGVIDMEEAGSYENYRSLHRNLKKKLKHYRSIGGTIEMVRGRMADPDIRLVGRCVDSTSRHSVFKLPYQENYPAMCMATASMEQENVVHFICRTEEDFLGYHSFMDFGTHLRCLNGAFNRELRTTHHAYENMIARVVEYAEEKKTRRIFFGPVLNETKRRMMHEFLPTTIHFMSNSPVMRSVFPFVLKRSRMMNQDVLQFRTGADPKS